MKVCERTGCSNKFKPTPPSKRFCTTPCRTRAARDGRAAEESADADLRKGHAEHELVTAVRAELMECGQDATVNGQIALQLARRMVNPNDPALDRLADKLQSLMDKCKGAGPATPSAAGSSEPASPSSEGGDEVDQAARRARDKLAAAADGSEVGSEADRA